LYSSFSARACKLARARTVEASEHHQREHERRSCLHRLKKQEAKISAHTSVTVNSANQRAVQK
jgi:hypothetical protein